MRLYLASQNLGPFTDELLKLVGKGRRALFIENARDYYPEEKRANDLKEKFGGLSSLGSLLARTSGSRPVRLESVFL